MSLPSAVSMRTGMWLRHEGHAKRLIACASIGNVSVVCSYFVFFFIVLVLIRSTSRGSHVHVD